MKSFFIAVLLTTMSMCKQTNPNEIVVYFMENYSYDWDRVSVKSVDASLMEKCEQYYHTAYEHGWYDGMTLKRVYKIDYLDSDYLILEFDFIDVFDYRICLVIESSSKEIIGYFERSQA